MTVYSQYRTADGTFTSHVADVMTRPEDGAGKAWIEGLFDHRTQRVNLQTQAVVDYRAPAPSADHEWNAASKRWILNEWAATKEARHRAAWARITQLETSQARALRELALGYDGAKQRVQAIDDEISALRADLK